MISISEEQVKSVINWIDTFKAVEIALKNVAQLKTVQTARTFTKVINSDNVLLSMPGYLEDENYGALACKLVTLCPNNAKIVPNLPTIHANILLFDEITGILKAVVAGTTITTWRTAAASAIATKHILKNKSFDKKSKILAILGAGVQAKAHAKAFQYLFDFHEIRVWNRSGEKGRALVDELNENGASVFKYVDKNEDCVRGADVIITATYATESIVQLEWVKKDAHINAIGVGSKGSHCELSMEIYQEADIYIDHWEGAKSELSTLMQQGVEFKGEIGSVITGDLAPSSPNRISVFQSLGMAAEDCAMAKMIYDKLKPFEIKQ